MCSVTVQLATTYAHLHLSLHRASWSTNVTLVHVYTSVSTVQLDTTFTHCSIPVCIVEPVFEPQTSYCAWESDWGKQPAVRRTPFLEAARSIDLCRLKITLVWGGIFWWKCSPFQLILSTLGSYLKEKRKIPPKFRKFSDQSFNISHYSESFLNLLTTKIVLPTSPMGSIYTSFRPIASCYNNRCEHGQVTSFSR